jgi:hypothetical protein
LGNALAVTAAFGQRVDSSSFSQGLIPFTVADAVQGFTILNTNQALSATLSHKTSETFNQFEAVTGVLLGVAPTLTIDNQANTFLVITNADGRTTTGTVNTNWTIQAGGVNPAVLASTAPTQPSLLAQTQISGTGAGVGGAFGFTNQWNQAALTVTPGNLNGFVGTGTLTSVLNTNLIIAVDKKTQTPHIAEILSNTNPQLPNVTGLSSTINLNYQYLQHSNASFADATSADLDVLDATVDAGSASSFTISALGNALDTTRLQYQGSTCTGDCTAFNLNLSFANLLTAGTTQSGSLGLIGDATTDHSATISLLFGDNSAVGVGSTQLPNTLTLHVSSVGTANIAGSVSAVPEPHGAAMLLAGLGAVGWLSRRRCRGADQRQVAKL